MLTLSFCFKKLVALHFWLLLGPLTLVGQVIRPIPPQDALMDTLWQYSATFPPGTQLAIGLVIADTSYCHGFLRQADTLLELDNATHLFEVGSITKVFTASLLAQLVTQGEVALDTPINVYLDFPIAQDIGQITFRELSNHTSGLPRLPSNFFSSGTTLSNPYANYERKQLIQYLQSDVQLPKDSIPNYAYSNLGAGLVGFILSELKRKSFDALMADALFKPYQMSHTYVHSFPDTLTFVEGLGPKGQVVSNWDFAALAGAGAIKSNVRDLSRFLIAQFDSTQQALQLTQRLGLDLTETMAIGLGWHYLKDYGLYWHNGGTGGYTSSMVFDPRAQRGVVILSNVSAFHADGGKVDALGLAIMALLR